MLVPHAHSWRARGATRAAFLAAVFAGVLLATAPPASGVPQTLVTWPTEIRAFAQDGPFVAWIARAPNTVLPWCGRTYIQSLTTGARRSFGTTTAPVCGGRVALGRNRALWTTDPGLCGNCQYSARVFTAALDSPRVVPVATVVAWWDSGTHLTGLAADWRLLAVAQTRYMQVDTVPHCFDEPVPCIFEPRGGRVTQVIGADRRPVPGVGAPALLAVGGGRVAVAPSADQWEDGTDVPTAEDGPVHVINPITGASVATVAPTGTVRALALSVRALAVLVERPDGSVAVERYALPAGTLVSSAAVNPGTAHQIDIGDKWILYRVGRRVRLIGPGGATRPLIHTAFTPIGLSIEGRRVAWATNGDGLHRIRAVLAPT